ncbi:MAG: hypothetical protein ACD_12C00258G0002 [uncultured bacterium]|nr:MAG: hypothetical protein ACD_12C00258G0002 [uncultured bacterium]
MDNPFTITPSQESYNFTKPLGNVVLQTKINIFAIILAVIITALITGACIYWWHQTVIADIKEQVLKENTNELQLEINRLKKQISALQINYSNESINENYISALQTANLFLTASVKGDKEIGYNYLSQHLKNSSSKENLKQSIIGLMNLHFKAFEISSGQYLDDNSYQFKLILYDNSDDTFKTEFDMLRVVKSEDGKWHIDSLPKKMTTLL